LLFLLFAVIRRAVSIYSRKLSGVKIPTSDAVMQALSQAKTPDALMIASDIASAVIELDSAAAPRRLLHRLYYDAKAAARTPR